MRKRRILSVIAAVAMAFCLAGCQKEDNSAGQVEQTSGESQQNINTEISFENWSPDDFTSVQCHGIDITIPCKFSDIDERFDVKTVPDGMGDGSDMVELYYNEEYVGALAYDPIDTDTLVFLRLESFDLYGLTEKSTKEDVQNKLGFSKDSDLFDSYWGNNITIGFEYIDEKTAVIIAYNEEGLTGQAELIDEISQQTTTITTQNEQTSGEAIEIKTIDPPEDGWTLDELMNVTYIYGKTINLPCTLNDLPKEFTYNKNEDYSINEEDNSIAIILKYHNDSIGSIVIQNCSTLDDISEQSIVCRLFVSDWLNDKNKDNIFVNGLLLDDYYESVVEKLGTPDITEDYSLTYCDKSTGSEMLSIALSDENKILGILFFVK